MRVVLTVFLMASPHIQMDVAFPAMVCSISVGKLGNPGAGIFRKRMEEGQVHGFGEKL